MRIQTSVDNTLNYQRYEIKFESNQIKTLLCSKHCFSFLKQKYILF